MMVGFALVDYPSFAPYLKTPGAIKTRVGGCLLSQIYVFVPTVLVTLQFHATQRWGKQKAAKSFSHNKAVRNGWGNRSNFQASYGLKVTQDDIEEGKEILKAMEGTDKAQGNHLK
ncbi:hypothetical protein CLAIMM_01845 [Cladophialophora immunda]|nr:hypothetical protein CLAIMM_01845 [Cladophialophora immunda]